MKWNNKQVSSMVAMILVAAVAVGGIAIWLGRGTGKQEMFVSEILRPAPNGSFQKLSVQMRSEDKDAEVDAAVEQVLAELNVFDASDYEKIKSVYYYVCTHVEYDHEALYDPNGFGGAGSIYNALILGKAVCSGYARLVERLLLKLDVECCYVSGNRGADSIGHAWNIVKLDGLYYIVDATNGADSIEPWDAYFLATYDDIPFEPDSWYLTDEWLAQHPMATERYLESCSGFYSNGVTWELDRQTRVLTITGEGPIPDDLPLWDSWRQFRWAVEGIIIGEGVTETGKNAFNYCANAQWISLPDSLQKISDGSFGRCSKLQELHIPSAVNAIGSQAFFGCDSLQELVVPASMETIGEYAFYGCESLRSLTLEGCVETIEDAAFSACEKLDFIHVAVQPITIHEWAFDLGVDPYLGKDQPYISAVYYDREEDAQAIVDWSSAVLCNALLSVGGTIGVPSTTGQMSSFVTDKLPITSGITYNGKEYTLYSDHVCIWAAFTEGNATRRYCTICDARKDVDSATHAYTAVVTEPGCFKGYTTYTCTDCGDSYVDHIIAALGHSFAEWEVLVPNSCTEDGVEAHICTVCGTQEERVLRKSHSWGEWYVTQEVGCSDLEQNGQQRRDCARCGYYETQILYATGHVWTDVVTPPTCTTDGYTTHTCVCGYSYVTDVVDAMGHDYVADHVTPPTCTKQGYTTYVCTGCGDSYDDDYFRDWPYGHDYVAGEILQAPTCTEEGKQAYSCTVCGKEWEEPVPATGHSVGEWYTSIEPGCYELGHDGEKRQDCANCDYHETYVLKAQWHVESYSVVIEPTCETAGRTEWYCECGYFLHYTDEVEPFWHNYVTTQISEPTCTQWGQAIFSCTICDYVSKPVNMYAPTGHTEVIDPEVAPDCTKMGLTEGKHCAVCGKVLVEQTVIDATGHSHEAVTVNPTCTEGGHTTYTCHCGDTYTEIIAATGHHYVCAAIAPTCTEDGYTTHTCHCGDSYVDSYVAANGHSYGDWYIAIEASCTAEGYQQRDCLYCDHSEMVVIDAMGHNYSPKVTDPTCTEQGYTTHICANCDDAYTDSYVDALGHAEVIVAAVAPTCTEPGLTEGKHCDLCGEMIVAQTEDPATGHSYTTEVVEPTCTERGYATYTCANCGAAYTSDYVDALGHSYDWVMTYPTCTENGIITYTCCDCGYSYPEEIPATGHQNTHIQNAKDATCGAEGYTGDMICDDCGAVAEAGMLIPATGEHEYGEWVAITEPTTEESGLREHSCVNCGHTEQEVMEPIAALLGDVNGDGKVNARDARLLLRYIAGLASEDELNLAAADYNADGRVNARDARAILRQIAGLD